MSDRRRVFTGTQWEARVGYCRAIRTGNLICVTGTTAVDENGAVIAPGDAFAQARRCFERIEASLDKLGSSLDQVVRTLMYVTDISRWEEYGRAHQEFFGDNPPAATMVQISALVDPVMLIEVEADAVVPS